MWLTSITIFEARFGLALLLKGKRRQALETAFEALVEEDFDRRILDFDAAAATSAAALAAVRQRKGCTVNVRHTQIAGIVLARRASLATRNVTHFDDIGATIIDP